MLGAIALLALAPSLTLNRPYRDGEADRFRVVIVGETEGTDLRVEATLSQTARIPKDGAPRLELTVERVTVSAYGERQNLQKGSKFTYEIDRNGRLVSGWVPDQRSAAGVAFLPYLLILTAFLGGAYLVPPAVEGGTAQAVASLLERPAELAADLAQARTFIERVRSLPPSAQREPLRV